MKQKLIEHYNPILMDISSKMLFIEQSCNSILENPLESLSLIRDLLKMLDDSEFLIIQASSLSLTEVFKDILPLYKINKEENQLKLKEVQPKEIHSQLTFELELLELYHKYLGILGSKWNLFKDKNHSLKKDFEPIYLSCLSELFLQLHHFNYSEDLINELLRNIAVKNLQSITLIHEFITKIMSNVNISMCLFIRPI